MKEAAAPRGKVRAVIRVKDEINSISNVVASSLPSVAPPTPAIPNYLILHSALVITVKLIAVTLIIV